METAYTANIIILGAPASGKKSFIRRYCEDIFTNLYDPITETSGDRRLANISGIATLINLERIPSTFVQSASEARRIEAEADALILLYDGSLPESLEELRRMQLKVLAPEVREGDEAPPIAVVASKADLAEAADTGTGTAWEQGIGEGSELAVQLGARFGVTSALWGDGVKDVVEELAARVLEMKGVEKEVLMGAGS
ncbi:Ff.00g072690.m01.CDS01 [Fusarium sp. VM40]|nr:Ff.00g072690.m01.CDS01 [Fusarium sp. VM40]